MHEQVAQYWKQYSKEKGEYLEERKRPLVTWVFEEGTFVPVAKLTEKQKLSIVTNYLGTPEAMYREDGEAVWITVVEMFIIVVAKQKKLKLEKYGKKSSIKRK